MGGRVASWLAKPNLLRSVLSHVRLAVRLVREPRVPLLMKTVPVLAVLYVLSPLDVIPDVLPIVGQLDDLGFLFVALELFVRWCPAGAVEFHRLALQQGRGYSPMTPTADFIDAQWRRS